MDYSLLILLGCILVKANVNTTPSINFRIVNGKAVTDRSQFAYQAGILDKANKNYFCGGAIIHERFILTAAHCCWDDYKVVKPSARLVVEVGNIKMLSFLDTNAIYKDVQSVIVHREFDNVEYTNDIALLAIYGTFTPWTKNVNQINLKTSTTFDENCIVSGFGATGDDDYTRNELLYGEVPVVDHDTCKKEYPEIPNNTICTRSSTSTCFGDSGGPLVCSNQLAGVISAGSTDCKSESIPSIFMEVAKYRDWIDLHIKNTVFAAKTIDSTTSPPSSAERRKLSLFFLLISFVPLLRFIRIEFL